MYNPREHAVQAAYAAWLVADAEFSQELRAEFGKRAGDMRYQPEGKGIPGTKLRAAYLAFTAGRLAWEAALRAKEQTWPPVDMSRDYGIAEIGPQTEDRKPL